MYEVGRSTCFDGEPKFVQYEVLLMETVFGLVLCAKHGSHEAPIINLVGISRMETVFRLLLHERKLAQGDTLDMKPPVQYERDAVTALGTTKWQLEQFEWEVNAAALSDKSNSRENAISKYRQFIKAIREQIAHVEESIENLRAYSSTTPKHLHSSELDADGLASFLSGGGGKDQLSYYCTNTDEIVEVKLDDIPIANGYSSKEHTACELGYSGKDKEAPGVFQCSCGENECQGDCNAGRMYDLETGDPAGGTCRHGSRLGIQHWGFMRNLWFLNRGCESFTKRRKDGEVPDDFRNGPGINMLTSFSSPERGTYFCKGWIPSCQTCQGSNIVNKISSLPFHNWPESVWMRLSRSQCPIHCNHPRIRLATAILIAVIVLGLLAFSFA